MYLKINFYYLLHLYQRLEIPHELKDIDILYLNSNIYNFHLMVLNISDMISGLPPFIYNSEAFLYFPIWA